FVPITLLNVAFPVLAVYHSESREKLLGATTRFYRALLGVGWPLSVGTVMLAPGINGLFDRSAQHQFGPAAAALQILGAGIFLMFTTNAFIAALNAMNRQVLFSWAAGVSLVVNVGLNLFLIPAYGFRGAAWATNLTELALLLTGWLMVRRVLGSVALARVSWRILLAGLLMAGSLYFFRAAHGWQVLLAILVGMVVYGFGLFLFRALEPEELTLARRALLRRA
ncbi:MAG TPA: polysaccharide biosynthesis C-terminal domain-containing protein, partial [Myxococcaceae bacterium]|nr:polysaccharide biosynthesis C-terminal domain-containing protein [Myxococcaceae bacterium]